MSIPVDMKAAGFRLKIQGKPDESQGRKAKGARLLGEAMEGLPEGPRPLGCI